MLNQLGIHKKAFKYNKPGYYDKKKVFVGSQADMTSAILRQKIPNLVVRVMKRLQPKMVRPLIREVNHVAQRAAGTIFNTPGGKRVMINKDYLRRISNRGTPSSIRKRNVLAHELFHAKTPIFGSSEIMAHMYGFGKELKGASKLKRALHSFKGFGHLVKTRPGRAISELAIPYLGALAVYRGTKKLLGNKPEIVKKPKLVKKATPFLEQDRPEKVKEIYQALKRDHPEMSAEMKARIAIRQGKRGKQKQGPPYKGPINND
jgi:hypothetical protein